ncbi:PGF-CTERM sorting domain-containing protein [Halosolutus gelatinilyticus]|uniref:PGF-CTERM sorting domain-containing protein n=1 Tax=Halosolutus gelatinilyticus TaxID=2931975 RepID=UPI001FF50488|nr:PGF-CTERM sorting domain-containing protein [Halosolutus gelatinilyticus]
MNRITTVALAAMIALAPLTAVVTGASATQPSAAVQDSESNAYAGTHVAFETSNDALLDYRVGGEQVFENVTVQSKQDHRGSAGAGADVGLGAVVDLSGIGLELDAQSQTRAEIATEGSASLTAHDSERGILTVDAGDEAQYVHLNLSSNAEASQEGDDRVIVETDERTGAFVVVGDGEVAVNDEGDVVADLESESTLVFRSYEKGERDEDAKEQERLIANGTATAEVYAEERDGERVADVATYGHDLTVETANESEERIEMTVERAQHEGTIVIVSISEAALAAADGAEDFAVTIDGEAAVEASSYGELEGGIGEEHRYMVTQSSDASAAADVLVAVEHFSEREVVVQSGDSDADGSDGGSGGDSNESDTGEGDDDDSDSVPGFGAVVSLAALLVAVVARVRR